MGSAASSLHLRLRLRGMKGIHKIEPLEEADIPTPVWTPINWNPEVPRRHSLPLSPKTRIPEEMPFFAKKKAKQLVERGMVHGEEWVGKGKGTLSPSPLPVTNNDAQESPYHLLTSTHPLGDVPTHSDTTHLGTFTSFPSAERLLHYVYALDPPCWLLGPAWEYAYCGPHHMRVKGWKAGILSGVRALGWRYLTRDWGSVRSVWVQGKREGWWENGERMGCVPGEMGMEVGWRENVRLDLMVLEWRGVGLALGEIGPMWCWGMGTAVERMGKMTVIPTTEGKSYSDEVVDAVDKGLWKPPARKMPTVLDDFFEQQPAGRSLDASDADDELDDEDDVQIIVDRPVRDTDSRTSRQAERPTSQAESARRGIEAMRSSTVTVTELSSNAVTEEDEDTTSHVTNPRGLPVAPALRFQRHSAPPSYHLHALGIAPPASRSSSGAFSIYTPSGSSRNSLVQDEPDPLLEAASFSPITASIQQDAPAAERATARFGPESRNVSPEGHAIETTEVLKDEQEYPWSPHHRQCGICSRIDAERRQGSVPFHLAAWKRGEDEQPVNEEPASDTVRPESLAIATSPKAESRAPHSGRDDRTASPVEHDEHQSPPRDSPSLTNGKNQDNDLYSVSDTQSQPSDDTDSVAVIISRNSRSASTEAFVKGRRTPNETLRSDTASVSQLSNRKGSADSLASRETLRESAEAVTEGDETLPAPDEILLPDSDSASQSSHRTESVDSVATRGTLRESVEAPGEADEIQSTANEILHCDGDAMSQSSDQPGSACSAASHATLREGITKADKTLKDDREPTCDTASQSFSNADTASLFSKPEPPSKPVEEVAQVRKTLVCPSTNGEQSQLPERPPAQSSWAAIASNANKGKENIVLNRSPSRGREQNLWSYPEFEIKVPAVWQDQTPLPATGERKKRGGRRKKGKKNRLKGEE